MKLFQPKIFFTVLTCILSIISCSGDNQTEKEEPTDPSSTKPNILLIIADDMGIDASPGYGIGSVKPNMPILQSMISNGVLYENVWSNPTCSPTRASIITGKYGFRTNVKKVGDQLSLGETSLQQYITNNTNSAYQQAVIGKWHLSTSETHANDMGIEYFAGFIRGGVPSYTDWDLSINGNITSSSEYTTTKFTDLAIDWVADQTKPWFLWLAYNAPHTPFHLPPTNLHSQGNLPTDQASIDSNTLPYYMAMLEAMDTEVGRLLSSMSETERENTIIIFIGDNGTPSQVVQEYGRQRAKSTIYEGGIHVPMVVSGKGVTRKNSLESSLINASDIFATIVDIAETGTTEINDSKSFKSTFTTNSFLGREYIYSEIELDSGGTDRTIRNSTHHLLLFADGTKEMYQLLNDPLEATNLLDANGSGINSSDEIIKNQLETALVTLNN